VIYRTSNFSYDVITWEGSLFLIALLTWSLFAAPSLANDAGFGHVVFANSGSPAAQKDFLEGMALLHDFEYSTAAEAFRRAQTADPAFAMAYWGEAMTFNHPIWFQQDLNAARASLNRLAASAAERRSKANSDREKEYLDAVEILYGEGSKEQRDSRYMESMAKLHSHYPDDVDATAFYALAILGTAHGGRNITTYMRAAGLLEEAWIDHREHPGVLHYLIHSYDDPTHATLGLRAARLYSKIAPDAGHAQHMTSHIFLALGMWKETVDANIAAIAAVDRQRKGDGGLRCGHYPSWLGYAYLQLGQMDKAKATLGLCLAAVQSEAAMDHQGHPMDPDMSLSGSFANMLLRYQIDGGDVSGDDSSWTLPKTAGPGARLDFALTQILKAIKQKNTDGAKQTLAELENIAREVKDTQTKRREADPTYRVRPDIVLLEARALLAEEQNDLTSAEQLLRQAVALEETLPIAFGPPTIDKPTHELLGEFLLRRGRKDEARSEFELALARTPGRRLPLAALASAR
jgi:tetratricopeptide (TPR) repeat protein